MAEDTEAFRYARHLLLEGWDQEALRDSTVVIVGVGALGCEIAKNLALAGVGTIHLVDMDIIEMSNLSRQLLFWENDRGRNKAVVAAEWISKANPDVRAEPHEGRFQDLPNSLFEEADLILGGLDSFEARFQLNELAWRLGKAYIDSASTGFKGNIQIIIPPNADVVGPRTPCLKCFYPIPPGDGAAEAACTVPGHARTREHCIIKGEETFVKEKGRREDYSISDLETIADMAHQASVDSPHTEEWTFTAPEVENVIMNKLPSVITVNAVVASVYGLFTPVEIGIDPNCQVCSRGVADEVGLESWTLGGLLDAIDGLGIPAAKALVTRTADGAVVSNFGKGEVTADLEGIGVKRGDSLRVTYPSGSERASIEITITEGTG
jgi:molybdopterin/thiamine biosynthesis adenylyltransferase